VDFTLNEDQRAILESVEGLLSRFAGPARAIELAPKADYDDALDAALRESGFVDVALGEETGPLEAALIVEAVARAAGVVSIGASALIAPGVSGLVLSGPIAVCSASTRGPVRFGAQARTLLIDDGAEARVVALSSGDALPVPSGFGYPVARLDAALGRQGESLGPGSGPRLRNWWRLAIAAEAVGTMRAALDVTVAYVKERRQFGRAIGSFQAVQHRLAECAVLVEGGRWLCYEAAFEGAPSEKAAIAAAHATATAGRVFAETHQLSGAMGFTREHDLHVWSMRLQALRLELDGVAGQRRAAARARWVQES
jgi:alkylation response protein AidB-like acyl-CoA dehydrogenase